MYVIGAHGVVSLGEGVVLRYIMSWVAEVNEFCESMLRGSGLFVIELDEGVFYDGVSLAVGC